VIEQSSVASETLTRPSEKAGARPIVPRPGGRRRSARRAEAAHGYLFISPWLVGLVCFTVGPMLASLYLSFTDYSGLSAASWTGLANYQHLVKDPLFWTSLYNTGYYVAFSVSAILVSAFAVAMLLSSDIPGIKIFRTFFYIPVAVPMVANALLWTLLFANEGLVNSALNAVGLPTFTWLFNPAISKLIFVSLGVWGLGTTAMIFVAGLRDIPISYYDAARVDGAGTWARFRYITLPLMAPVILFNLVIGVINSFQVFTAAYIISGGGPANSTLFYVLYLYQNGFQNFDMGYASALAWVLFLIILAFTAAQFRLARSFVYYEAER
jgi:multiple sugar transport system permease protein